jgi:hypothetical protein
MQKRLEIGQSAAKFLEIEKGSTTIPEGSTPKWVEAPELEIA